MSSTAERWLARAVVALLAAGFVAFLVRGADQPADPRILPAPSRVPIEGFGEVAVQVVAADGTVLDWCALLAATAAARQQGLMGRRDLSGYEAMVFRFEGPVTGSFYMYRTLVPLSIAFVDAGGAVVSVTDMEPCPSEDPDACPRYAASAPYQHAVETLRGGLGELGLAPGATVRFGATCT